MEGMKENIRQAKQICPGWQVIVYHDDTVPSPVMEAIKSAGAMTVQMDGNIYGMFWRFFAADLNDCEYAIFRDSDSRLSVREKAAVDEWINSGNTLHVMRDHPYHQHAIDNQNYHILGGMWGIKGGSVPITAMISNYISGKTLKYGSDQFFLNEIYDRLKNSVTLHDEFFGGLPFPVKRAGYRFIGERYNANGMPDGDDWKAIKAYYESNTLKSKLKKKIKTLFHRLIH